MNNTTLKVPKIYVFLNGIINEICQYASVADDGNCLATEIVKIGSIDLAWAKLGPHSQHVNRYKSHYPFGYELVWISDINAPENKEVLRHIRIITQERVQREHDSERN